MDKKTASEKKKKKKTEITNDSDKRSLGVRACMHSIGKAKGITRERDEKMSACTHSFVCVCARVCVCVSQ